MPDLPPRLRTAYDHLRAGRLPAARAALESALRRDAADTDANSMMCWVLRELGELEPALFHARRALEGAPNDPNLLVNLGNLLGRTGDTDGAIGAYQRARAFDPLHRGAAVGLSAALGAANRLDEALAVAQDALAHSPGHPKHAANAASALLYMGRAREAVARLREAVARNPADATLARALCIAGLYAGTVSPAESSEAHRRLAALLTAGQPPWLVSAHPRRESRSGEESDRPLRVGLVSGDFRRHSCAYFIEPLLEHLDRERYPTVCYFTRAEADALTARLRRLAGAWRDAVAWPTDRLVGSIRSDRIDVLLDLSGLTDGHRLDVFARRPAPVQATWLGYPAGTGLPELSLRIVDAATDPVSEQRLPTSERLVRIEGCSVCYRPPVEAPAPERSTGAAGTPFTFGAFNALAKLDDDCVALWAGVLRAAPQSRLLIRNGGLRSEGVREFTRGRFERMGVEPSRIIVEPPVADPREVVASYSRVDAALDSMPYNGTTTTCEALLMGVPVLTLAGATTASRMGVSLLSHAGFPEWIARDPGALARLGADLAGRGPRTTADRAALRTRFLASPVCDGPGFARRFGDAIRSMWRDRR